MLGAVLASMLFLAFYLPEPVLKQDGYTFYRQFTGFFGACCTYTIKRNKFLLFQKNVGEFSQDGYDMKDSRFKVIDNTGYLTVKMESYDWRTKQSYFKDTTLLIILR